MTSVQPADYFSGPRVWILLALITVIGFFYFPGHTYLRSDSLIYLPILERQQNPLLFEKDLLATRPFGYSIYDEAAIALTTYTPLPLKGALELEQFVFRGVAVAGLYMTGLGLGLSPTGAWFVAAVGSLGAPVAMETEPIPRAFAMSCMLLGIGLAIRGVPLWAGILGSVAILYHPITAISFAAAIAFAVIRRSVRPSALLPLLIAPLLLLLLAHFGPATAEPANILHRLDADEEAFQKMITPYIFVSEWSLRTYIDPIAECAITLLALWALRQRLRGAVIDLLGSLFTFAVAAVPASWLVEVAGFPQLQLTRAVALIPLMCGLLATANAVVAAERGQWAKSGAWIAAPLILLAEGRLITYFVTPEHIATVAALAAAMTLGLWFAKRTHGLAVVAAGLILFVVLPGTGLADSLMNSQTPELEEVAKWAREKTIADAVFLLPDASQSNEPALFRALSLRSVYVDWKIRGQANYFPGFAAEWRRRWSDTHEERWILAQDDMSTLKQLQVDYVVVRTVNSIPGLTPDFRNPQYCIYSVR